MQHDACIAQVQLLRILQAKAGLSVWYLSLCVSTRHCYVCLGVPGALALSVTVMGTIMAATTGIIGASITVMGVMALKPMLQYGYSKRLTTGVIAASGQVFMCGPLSVE